MTDLGKNKDHLPDKLMNFSWSLLSVLCFYSDEWLRADDSTEYSGLSIADVQQVNAD